MKFLLALAAVFLSLLFFTPAMAADGTVIDLSPILNQVILIVASVLSVLGVWVLAAARKYLQTKTGLDLQSQEDIVRQYLDKAMNNAVQYALQKVQVSDWSRVDVKDQLIAQALSYVLTHVPDALAYFKMDEESIKSRLLAILNKHDPSTPNVN